MLLVCDVRFWNLSVFIKYVVFIFKDLVALEASLGVHLPKIQLQASLVVHLERHLLKTLIPSLPTLDLLSILVDLPLTINLL
jgi:hypothetical protein